MIKCNGMKFNLFYIVLGILIWIGCNDTETLTPSQESEPIYILPQGDHDYDEKIVEWYKRCGFYILYKFEPRDIYFNWGMEWFEVTTDTLFRKVSYKVNEEAFVDGDAVIISTESFYGEYTLGEHTTAAGFKYKATLEGEYVLIEEDYEKHKGKDGFFRVNQPDEAYVGKQMEWVDKMFLSCYQDSLLKENLPLKLILGKNVHMYTYDQQKRKGFVLRKPFVSAYNVFVISHGDESIDRMSMDEKRQLKGDLHKWFLVEKLYSKIYSTVGAGEFFSFTDYQKLAQSWQPPYNNYYSMGVVGYKHKDYPLVWPQTEERIKNNDLKSFICMVIDHSYNRLTTEPPNGNFDMNDCTGVLNRVKDKEGLIRTKYEILTKHFEELGIDLQGIGDKCQ